MSKKTSSPHVVAARVTTRDHALIQALASANSMPVSTLLAEVVSEGVRERLRLSLDDEVEADHDQGR